jgi:hypothetical protein
MGLGGEAMEKKEGSSALEQPLIKAADFIGRGSTHGVSRFPRGPRKPPATASGGSRIWIKGGLNNVDLKLKLEINDNLLQIICYLMNK